MEGNGGESTMSTNDNDDDGPKVIQLVENVDPSVRPWQAVLSEESLDADEFDFDFDEPSDLQTEQPSLYGHLLVV